MQMNKSVQEYLDEIQIVANAIYDYLDDKELNSIEQIIINRKIHENYELFLRFLKEISNNHHRCSNFYSKIETILLFLKDAIVKHFKKEDIIKIFLNNKRILLFLINEKIIFLDNYFLQQIQYKYNYFEYFTPEIKIFLKDSDQNDQNRIKVKLLTHLPENFEENRKIGENENYICQLIRNDSIIDFITYVNKTNLYLDTKLQYSIFETNEFLILKNPTLIEYASFYGSIQIFKYLQLNNVKISTSLLLYAVHSKNAELIHLIIEITQPKSDIYYQSYIESIKCHHNDIAIFIKDNLLENKNKYELEDFNCFKEIRLPHALLYYNFHFFPNDLNCVEFPFYFLYEYKYIEILKIYLSDSNIDLDNFIFDIDNYEIIENIEKVPWDGYLNIYVVQNKYTSQKYIIKEINAGYEYGAENFERTLKVNYPCILKVKGYCSINFNHRNGPSILFEYIPNHSLLEYIKNKQQNKDNDTKDYILILGIAIIYLFLCKQNHLSFDISFTNIYLDENLYPVLYNAGASFRTILLPFDYHNKHKRTVENHFIDPPEFLESYRFGIQSYSYQYAIIVYFIIVRKFVFEKEMDFNDDLIIIESIVNGNRPKISLIENEYITNFITKCWNGDYNKRMPFKEIIDYITNKEFISYFKDLDHNSVIEYLNMYGDEFDFIKKKFYF